MTEDTVDQSSPGTKRIPRVFPVNDSETIEGKAEEYGVDSRDFEMLEERTSKHGFEVVCIWGRPLNSDSEISGGHQ